MTVTELIAVLQTVDGNSIVVISAKGAVSKKIVAVEEKTYTAAYGGNPAELTLHIVAV